MLVGGVGDAFSQRYYSSCFALYTDEAWVLVDCPHPIRKIYHEAEQAAKISFDLEKLGGVFLTHLHADHSSGLEGLIFYVRFVLGRKLCVYTHADIATDLWERCLSGGMGQTRREAGNFLRRRQDDLFDLVVMKENEPIAVGPFEVQCRLAVHSIPTIALRFAAHGASLGYSADTAFDRPLIDWLAAADQIIHEASSGPMHTALGELTRLPASIKQRMRLIHYPDDFNTATSPIEALCQGVVYHIEAEIPRHEKKPARASLKKE